MTMSISSQQIVSELKLRMRQPTLYSGFTAFSGIFKTAIKPRLFRPFRKLAGYNFRLKNDLGQSRFAI